MKGKKILTLVSLACGVGVVGATFAAWAVSDQADPFGIKVSPGSLTPSDTTFVTLKYGGAPVSANVSNLAAGKPRLAAKCTLLAETSTTETYPGKFTIKLTDQTEGTKAVGAAKLIDKLVVDVYAEDITGVTVGNEITAGTLDGKESVAHIPPEPGTYEDDVTFSLKTGMSQDVSVVVSLGQCEAKELTDIAEDVVYLQMDWGKGGTTGEVEAFPLYLSIDSTSVQEGEKLFVYAWNGDKPNADFPGVEMTKVSDGIYSYMLDPACAGKVIFSKGLTKDTTTKVAGGEAGITIGDEVTKQTAPCYSVSTSQWISKPDSTLDNNAWYLKGTINSWTASAPYKFTVDPSNEHHFTLEGVSLKTTDKIKVWKQNGNLWRGCAKDDYDGCTYTLDEEGNVSPLADGVYTVNFYDNGENNNFIVLAKAA